MQLPLLAAAAVGVGLMSVPQHLVSSRTGERVDLVGSAIYSTESHVPRWGEPLRAEDVALRDMGRIEGIVADPEGGQGVLLVSVGGLWGWGAQSVEVGMDRLRLMPTDEGESRLVVDLSAEGAEPLPDAIEG